MRHNKALYEKIMSSISREVKRTLNEGWGDSLGKVKFKTIKPFKVVFYIWDGTDLEDDAKVKYKLVIQGVWGSNYIKKKDITFVRGEDKTGRNRLKLEIIIRDYYYALWDIIELIADCNGEKNFTSILTNDEKGRHKKSIESKLLPGTDFEAFEDLVMRREWTLKDIIGEI